MSQITNNYAPGSCVFQAGSSQNGDVHIENCTIYQGKTDCRSRLMKFGFVFGLEQTARMKKTAEKESWKLMLSREEG